MQQLIDAYELFIKSVDMIIRFEPIVTVNYPRMIRTPLDEEMRSIWRHTKDSVKEPKG